ncbi:hypothetical protein EDF67_102508 [Sphingobacterium sp. JUb78]|nr:hypothetical protein [Sphingobacterium kitahiroshimense]TCR13094.1 hypothetical protein EDF67_102508 [Sphingobacterium sp. JUb78]
MHVASVNAVLRIGFMSLNLFVVIVFYNNDTIRYKSFGSKMQKKDCPHISRGSLFVFDKCLFNNFYFELNFLFLHQWHFVVSAKVHFYQQ